MKIRAFTTHKVAEKYKDCQDSFSVDDKEKSIAVADGMSQSIFPKEWATLITETYTKNKEWDCTEEQIVELGKQWQEKANKKLQEEKKNGGNPWMLENCISQRKGAGSTFCGIRFNGNNWKGIVLGDTSLFEIGIDDKLDKLDKTPDGDFGNHPDYFDSYGTTKGELKQIEGTLEENKKIIIASDPIGELIYNKSKEEEGSEQKYIKRFLEVDNHDNFCKLIDDLRGEENMHNDDSTIVIVEYDGSEEFDIKYEDNIDNLINEESESKEKEESSSEMKPAAKAPEEKEAVPSETEPNVKKAQTAESTARNVSQSCYPQKNEDEIKELCRDIEELFKKIDELISRLCKKNKDVENKILEYIDFKPTQIKILEQIFKKIKNKKHLKKIKNKK
jgi:hypothetical protein